MGKKIAVLAVQGAFIEHERALAKLGCECIELRQGPDVEQPYDALVLPGGESTAQAKMLRELGMLDTLKSRVAVGLPVLGTCAGLILLAQNVEEGVPAAGDPNGPVAAGATAPGAIGTLPVTVRRNAYGRQLGSFVATADFGASDDADAVVVASGESVSSAISAAAGEEGASEASDMSVVLKDFPLVFIRGPFVAEVGERTTVETSVDGNVVGLRQGKILATAFHPELTDDTRIHELFLSL